MVGTSYGGRNERRRVYAEKPLYFFPGYHTLPTQLAFHRSTARFKGFSGPVGSGKSYALCAEAILLARGNPGRLGLIGAPTYPMLRDATLTTMFEILDQREIKHSYLKAENLLILSCEEPEAAEASRIIFRPVDDFDRLRGTNLAWFGLDEMTYTPEGAWLRLEARLRDPLARHLCGFGVWTPKGFDWVYQRFVVTPGSNYRVFLAEANENHFLLDKVPDFYERLKNSYDEGFYQQEVLGKYLNVESGLVYNAFQRTDHIREMRVDPAQIEGQRVFVLDELCLRHASTTEACAEFERRFPNHAGGVVIYGDASGNSQHTTGASDYQLVNDYFRTKYGSRVSYKVPKSNPSVRERVMLTNSKLRAAGGDISLWVSSKCKELIKDFEQVSYKADSNAIDKDRDRRRTHLSDALGYLLWQEFRPQARIGEQGGRLF